MPSKNTGKTIKNIRVNKKNVVITFSDGKKINTTNEVMANFYLYPGKEISSKELKAINDFSEVSSLLKHAMSLIRKRHYSEWKMREKLYAKDAKKNSVDKVIRILKNADLLDDRALAEDLYCYYDEKNYGKNKIINSLSEEGIFDEVIKRLKFPSSSEKKKALNQLPKLEKKYAKYSYEQKKQHIYATLISLGFDSDIALSALEKMKAKNNKDENDKLNKDFDKVVKKYKSRYIGRELKEKVISSLRNKGYRLNDILRKYENSYDENDFGI